ncbi:MAG: hypothetical protein IPK32_23385 [Verrucomicrobiaceae bacterium]|nr:hypothetical protein [Verrucomicrobiaceae bacterium]
MNVHNTPAPKRLSAWTLRRWTGIFFLFVLPAVLFIGDPLTIVMFAPIFGPAALIAHILVWKVSQKFIANEFGRRLLCFLVPVTASGWLLFTLSFFYGRPRSVIAMAMQEPPPLLFWTRSFVEDGWTDYVFRMHVTIDPDYLKSALERHFNGPIRHGGTNSYHWKNHTEGATCTVETDDAFSFAKISYGTD